MTAPSTLRVLSALVLALALAAPAWAQGEALEIGARLPLADRAMPTTSGSTTTLGQVMGNRGLAVIFWCNTCPWVKKYEDRVVALANEYMAAGFGFIAVNANDPVGYPDDNMDAMRQQADAGGYPFPYVADAGSEAARAFGATRTPQIFRFEAGGTLVYEGTVDDSSSEPAEVEEHYFRDALNQVVAGEPVAVQKTRAFGCTIKFQ